MNANSAERVGPGERTYRFLGLITVLYVTFQLISDVTAGKLIDVFGVPVSVTVLYFPVTYIISDVLTEVYGYARARQVLWMVLGASITAMLIYQVVAAIPGSAVFPHSEAYRVVFTQVPRTLAGGWIAVFAGDIANNYVMARLKVITKGRYLWVRTIGSTIVGQGLNTALFYLIALSGIIPFGALLIAILAGWVFKTLVEVIMTPATYWVCGLLKRVESEDYYDRDTNFNPLKFKVD